MKGCKRVVRAIGAVALAAIMGTGLASPASAAWLRADSKHFIIYSDTNEAALRNQATDLEIFDASLRRLQHLPDSPDAEFNKVTVYVLPTIDAVQTLYGRGGANIAGFYVPRVSGSVAFTPRQANGGSADPLSSRIVLFHEYAHHFLIGSYPLALPAWFSEGFAEFASTMMEKNGDYWLGAPAQHRAYSLLVQGRVLTAAQLFDPPAKMSEDQMQALYARGWLLTHLIEFDRPLAKQFASYLEALNTGTPSPKAATEAFGDLKLLDKRLEQYLNRSTIPALQMKGSSFAAPVVNVRALTAGEAALIRMRMESTRGVNSKTAGPLYARAKAAMAKAPGDPVAQGWLAEMAFDAGDDAGADAAADAALALDPRSSQALLYKAHTALRRLIVAKSKDPAAWTAARRWIIKANRAQNNDAAALALFYQSFDMEGSKPSPGAVAGLYRAIELAPEDTGLRFAAARQRLIEGATNDAKALLRPLAYDPHASRDNYAVRLLALLDGGASGTAALESLRQAEVKGETADNS